MFITALTLQKFVKLSLALVNVRFGLFSYVSVAGELVIYNKFLSDLFVSQR